MDLTRRLATWRRVVLLPPLLIALALLIGSAQALSSRPLARAKNAELRSGYPASFGRPLILIDAGHGGRQPGAARPHSPPEKDVNLRVAKALEAHLEATGRYRVELTRRSDVTLGIRARAKRSRRLRPAAFLSIHANATQAETSDRRGSMLIASRRQRPRVRRSSEALARWLARGLDGQGFPLRDGPRKPEKPRSFDYLAKAPGVWVTQRRRLGVLRGNTRPAVLVETHYLDNPADVAAFQNDDAIGRFCQGIEVGLLNFLR